MDSGSYQYTAEIYSPPYLFDGAPSLFRRLGHLAEGGPREAGDDPGGIAQGWISTIPADYIPREIEKSGGNG